MHIRPRHFLIGKSPQHLPRRAPPAHSYHKPSTNRHSTAGIGGNNLSGSRRDIVRSAENFRFHI
jgi:hypothetical protein